MILWVNIGKKNTALGISIDVLDFVLYVVYNFCFSAFLFNHFLISFSFRKSIS